MQSLKYCFGSEQRDVDLVTGKEDVNTLIQTSICRTSDMYNAFHPRTSKHFRPTQQLNFFASLTGQVKHKGKVVESKSRDADQLAAQERRLSPGQQDRDRPLG